MIAADLIRGAFYDPPIVCAALEIFVTGMSSKGIVFRSEQFLELIRWFGNVEDRNGVGLDVNVQLVRHGGRFLQRCSSDAPQVNIARC